MGDYISRDAAIQAIEDIDENAGARGSGFTDPERIMRDSAFYALEAVPAADVRPADEISDSMDEAIDYLTSVSNQMPYHVYSALFDLICGICPTCGADMRENKEGTV